MAHRNQLRSPLRRHDSRRPRHLERVALGILRQCPQHFRCHQNECASLRFSRRSRLPRHVYHAGLALFVVVGKTVGTFLRHRQQVTVLTLSLRRDSRPQLSKPSAARPHLGIRLSPQPSQFHRINRTASTTTPFLPPRSARGPEESQHSSSPAPAQRCRPTPATEPTPPQHSQTLPKAPPEEISSSRS